VLKYEDHRSYLHSLKDHCHDKAHVWAWLTPIFIFFLSSRNRNTIKRATNSPRVSLEFHELFENLFIRRLLTVCLKGIFIMFMLCEGRVCWKEAHALYYLPTCMHLCSYINSRPNDRNISTQHIATLLGPTYYILRAFGHPVAICFYNWVLLAQIWPFWSNLTQQHTACRNTSQQGLGWPNARNI